MCSSDLLLLCTRSILRVVVDAGTFASGTNNDTLVTITVVLHVFRLASLQLSIGFMAVTGELLQEHYKVIVHELMEHPEGKQTETETWKESLATRIKRLQDCFDLYTRTNGWQVLINLLECSFMGLIYAYRISGQSGGEYWKLAHSAWTTEIGTLDQYLRIFLIAHVGQSFKNTVSQLTT